MKLYFLRSKTGGTAGSLNGFNILKNKYMRINTLLLISNINVNYIAIRDRFNML
jgi:hypothetical protein